MSRGELAKLNFFQGVEALVLSLSVGTVAGMNGILSVATCVALTGIGFAQEKANGRVMGQVLGPLHEPVPNAIVRITMWDQDLSHKTVAETRADGTGLFIASGLPTVGYGLVWATSPGLHRGATYVSWNSIRRGPVFTTAQLYSAARINGTVTDQRGKPILGAQVVASTDGREFRSDEYSEVVTDQEGRFTFEKVALGDVHVRASAPEFLLGEANIYLEKDTAVDLKLERGEGVRLRVKVVGVPKEALPGVTVRVRTRALPRRLVLGKLDDRGIWEVNELPSDAVFRVSIHERDLGFDPEEQKMEAGQDGNFTFQAAPRQNKILEGRIKTVGGEPLRDQVLRVWSRGITEYTTTDERGQFAVAGPFQDGQRLRIHLEGSDMAPVVATSERFLAYEATHWVTTVDLKGIYDLVAQPGVSFEGVARSAEGHAVVGCLVEAQCEVPNRRPSRDRFGWVRTDRQGRFEFRGLPPLSLPVFLSVADRVGAGEVGPFAAEAGAAQKDLEIRLSEPSAIEGVVKDQAGTPVPGARVRLRTWDLDRQQQRDSRVVETITDSQGRYRHAGVAPGGYFLQVRVVGRDDAARIDPFEVMAGKTVKRDIAVSR